MKLSNMVLGLVLGFVCASSAMAGQLERVKLEVAFVDVGGQMKAGKLDLVINSAGEDSIYVRDVTASNGERYPLVLRTGLIGASYMFQATAQNAQLICGELGFAKASVESVTAQLPMGSFKLSEYLLVKTPGTNLTANGSSNFQSISIVKCSRN